MILEIVKSPPWAKSETYIRRKPNYSSDTPARIANRLRFAEAAHAAYGEVGYKDGMPIVAKEVQDKMLQKVSLDLPDLDNIEVRVLSPRKIIILNKNKEGAGEITSA